MSISFCNHSITELKDGFKRMLQDFGLWTPGPSFTDAWEPIWQQFVQAVNKALTVGHHDINAPILNLSLASLWLTTAVVVMHSVSQHIKGSSFTDLTFEVFTFLTRRLKLEILLHDEYFMKQLQDPAEPVLDRRISILT